MKIKRNSKYKRFSGNVRVVSYGIKVIGHLSVSYRGLTTDKRKRDLTFQDKTIPKGTS